VVLPVLVLAAHTRPPERPACQRPNGTAPLADPSLYCLEMVPVPDLRSVAGIAELGRAQTPFGLAVSRDGVVIHDLSMTLAGLPAPESLGPYSAFLAWLTAPDLEPVARLGPVANGRTALGPVALNKFLILVTAEASADAPARAGRLVLRGASPSLLMLPHDLSLLPAQDVRSHRDHDSSEAAEWRMPPMHRTVRRMIPGLERLQPRVAPFLPDTGHNPHAIAPARPRRLVTLADGDTLRLEAGLVRRRLGGNTYTMYGFNGQYPGPLIAVKERATVTVRFVNRLDQPSTIHWHGIRLDNRFDGVPGVTQAPVAPGDSFVYRVRLPDPGIYWYHPHVREDMQQDLGLYGNLMVRPRRSGHFGPANREAVLMLDDLLLDDTGIVPYGRAAATHALMGRFGNLLLVNGEPAYRLTANRGEVVRFYLTNVAGARTFNVSFGGMGARVKVVGSDLGRYQREEWVENVVIAPAERYVVDARFERAGEVTIENRVQAIDHTAGVFFPEVDTLGTVTVRENPVAIDHSAAFGRLRERPDAAIARARRWLDRPPDRELVATLKVHDLPFGLIQVLRLDTGYVHPVEWNATMPMMDWLSSAREVEWVLRDPASGRENMAIDWRFRRGQWVKLRLHNDRHTLHPMAHPIHVHGQRFLVLAEGGVPNDNLVWKDTVLLPVGQTADILIEMTNPGRWMLHCHVTEHLGAGMHTVFTVD
jgi:FtsP/CotA-like multicopper oxidase with cupredoxin domain